MLQSYLILDLPLNASDDQVRSKYIDLVKQYPPEKDPLRFREITAAYESVKDKRKRVHTKIFGGFNCRDAEAALNSLVKPQKIQKKRVGLKELIKAAKV